MKIKLNTSADEAKFSEEDFSRHGIKQGAVVFNAANGFVANLTKEAAAFLLAQGNDVVKATKADEEEAETEDDPEEQSASGEGEGQ